MCTMKQKSSAIAMALIPSTPSPTPSPSTTDFEKSLENKISALTISPAMSLHKKLALKATKKREQRHRDSKLVAQVKTSRSRLLKKRSRNKLSIGAKFKGKKGKQKAKKIGLWPQNSLYFKTFPDDEAYTYVHDVLLERGWKFAGVPYKGDDTKTAFPKALKKTQPRRCLWFVDEHEAQILSELPESDLEGGRHKISCFLGTEAANYKTNLTLKLNDFDWFPKSYAMPKEYERFERDKNSLTGAHDPLWIYKPRNDYGGAGCLVYDRRSKEFKDRVNNDIEVRRNFVLQRYIENPLLIGGYKFHMRVFLLLTSIDPPMGYLYKGAQVLFSTKKYDSSPSLLGKQFDPLCHLTNWSIHGQPQNHKLLLEKKPEVGVGCEWRCCKLMTYLNQKYPKKFSESDMWNQLLVIGRETLMAIKNHDTCRRYAKKMKKDRHFEIFGMDILMDDNFKCWLMECNNSPGLNESPVKVPIPASAPSSSGNDVTDKNNNPKQKFKNRVNKGAREANKDTRNILHDMFAMLGYDSYSKHGSTKNFVRAL